MANLKHLGENLIELVLSKKLPHIAYCCKLQVVTNSGRASTLAATDAATPTLRRIERAAIAAATPITYHSR